MKLKGKESKLRKSFTTSGVGTGAVGEAALLSPRLSGRISAHGQQGHILSLLFAETTTSETNTPCAVLKQVQAKQAFEEA